MKSFTKAQNRVEDTIYLISTAFLMIFSLVSLPIFNFLKMRQTILARSSLMMTIMKIGWNRAQDSQNRIKIFKWSSKGISLWSRIIKKGRKILGSGRVIGTRNKGDQARNSTRKVLIKAKKTWRRIAQILLERLKKISSNFSKPRLIYSWKCLSTREVKKQKRLSNFVRNQIFPK